MEKILYVGVCVIGIIILLAMMSNLKHTQRKTLTDYQKDFFKVCVALLVMQFFDALSILVNGENGSVFFKIVNYASLMIYFVTQPIVVFYLYCYVVSRFGSMILSFASSKFKSGNSKKIILLALFLPIIINAVLTFIPSENLIFYVDAHNKYVRGDLIFVSTALSLSYWILVLIDGIGAVFKGRDSQARKNAKKVIAVFLFPIIMTFVQLFVKVPSGTAIPSYPLIWISLTFVQFIVFEDLRSNEIRMDALTQTFHRNVVGAYLDWKRHFCGNNLLFIVVLDIDKFKYVNDRYGHSFGDRILVEVSDILKDVCKKQEFLVSRYGGDEFLICGVCENQIVSENLVREITRRINALNESDKYEFNLSLSKGISYYRKGQNKDYDRMIKEADSLMYSEKEMKADLIIAKSTNTDK